MKSSLAVPLAIIIGGTVVAGAVYLSLREPAPPQGTNNPGLVRPVDSRDHILGNPAAPVMIVEYTDFDCGFCKDFDETLRQIIANEGATGEVAWVHREFPLTEIHPNAFMHARAAECAAEVAGNDAFWRFTEALFAAQPIDPSTYGVIAASVDISDNSFATCLSLAGQATASSTINARIHADRQNALDMGAEGTPFSLILVQGRSPVVMAGAYPYDAVKRLIDEALEQRP